MSGSAHVSVLCASVSTPVRCEHYDLLHVMQENEERIDMTVELLIHLMR